MAGRIEDVSAFHSLRDETVKQTVGFGNTARNAGETLSLKTLALLVLERNRQQNKGETRQETDVSAATAHETNLDVTDYAEWYEERAAIYEYDGGYSRSEAEAFAIQNTLALYCETHRLPKESAMAGAFLRQLHFITGFHSPHAGV